MRDAILVPQLYEKHYKGNYELLRYDDERAKGGADTIANGKRIDEKIVRWPKDREEEYTAFALELRSCTTDGHERLGWMSTNDVDLLLYCFSDRAEQSLDCYVINFPKLKEWFFSVGEEAWPVTRTTQINKTECRVVPISDVRKNVPLKQLKLSCAAYFDKAGHFVHRCYCGKRGTLGFDVNLLNGKLGTWYCGEHKPADKEDRSCAI